MVAAKSRHTVIRVITAHLKADAAVSWLGLNPDFTGVVFSGGEVRCGSAEFSGGTVGFGSRGDWSFPRIPLDRHAASRRETPQERRWIPDVGLPIRWPSEHPQARRVAFIPEGKVDLLFLERVEGIARGHGDSRVPARRRPDPAPAAGPLGPGPRPGPGPRRGRRGCR